MRINSISHEKLFHVISFLFLFTFFIFLTGCGTVHKKDGPPSFYVDETKIPNAVPKPEKLSKYGNKPSYVVFGKRYHVMSSSKNYEERGIASWYGTAFHSRHTSNGERYNMLAMTAAHKSLPLPTYVQVTNLRNGKQVIVKVNDRGPFESNRIIDLSYVAAKKLGMLGHGTAYVDVKAINPNHPVHNNVFFAKNKYVPHRKEIDDNSFDLTESSDHHLHVAHNTVTHSHHALQHQPMYLQVGVFRHRINAERLKMRLASRISSPIQITKKGLYHVKVGPIKNMASADRITEHLKLMGLKAYVSRA